MNVALAQLNLTVGALDRNARRLLDAWQTTQRAGAAVTLTPELSLCGFSPKDLLLRRAFVDDCAQHVQAMAAQVDRGVLIVGLPELAGGRCYNSLAVLHKGKVRQVYRKQVLRADEQRYFETGEHTCVFDEGAGRKERVRFALLFGDDLTQAAPARLARAGGAQCALVADAHAYQMDDEVAYPAWLTERAKTLKLPLVVAQHIGGQDAQVFMGASMAVTGQGEIAQFLPAWHEAVAVVRLKQGVPEVRDNFPQESAEHHVYQALVVALRDYVQKNGFPGVVLGLSGGADSALVLALAVDALGRERVHTFMLSSPYTSAMSLTDAKAMADLLSVTHRSMALAPLMTQVTNTLLPHFDGPAAELTAQNIQARLRALLLMGLSNQHNWLLLSTGNKSESAAGYATLYGDMAGGFAPLKDVSKTWVYRLAHYRNSLGRVIPERILTRAPSAELAHGQTDQDVLPPYPVLDAIIEGYVERGEDAGALLEQGFEAAHIEQTLRLLMGSEYKRHQAVTGPCITARAFADDWRYPMTSRWRESLGERPVAQKGRGKSAKAADKNGKAKVGKTKKEKIRKEKTS